MSSTPSTSSWSGRSTSGFVDVKQERENRQQHAGELRSNERRAWLTSLREAREAEARSDMSDSASSYSSSSYSVATADVNDTANFPSQGVLSATIATSLEEKGFVVIKPEWLTTERLKATQQTLLDALADMPEFQKPSTDEFVLGGFAALGNPSSFHNMPVRKLRQQAHSEVLPILSHLLKKLCGGQQIGSDWRVEQLIDRLLYRKAFIKPPGFQGRDVAPLPARKI
jgi:hypothetical protein